MIKLEKKVNFSPSMKAWASKPWVTASSRQTLGWAADARESLPLQYHTWLVPYHPTMLLNSTSVIVICLYIFPSDVSIWKAVILSSSLTQHIFWMPTICQHWFRNWKVGHKRCWQNLSLKQLAVFVFPTAYHNVLVIYCCQNKSPQTLAA